MAQLDAYGKIVLIGIGSVNGLWTVGLLVIADTDNLFIKHQHHSMQKYKNNSFYQFRPFVEWLKVYHHGLCVIILELNAGLDIPASFNTCIIYQRVT